MPIKSELLRNGHLLLRTLTDPLDIGDLLEDFSNTREVHEDSPYKIHLIFDATKLHKFPNNLLSFWRSAEKTVVAQTGNIVIVSGSGFVKTITALVSHVTQLQPVTVSTLDEAVALVDRWLAEETGQVAENSPTQDISER